MYCEVSLSASCTGVTVHAHVKVLLCHVHQHCVGRIVLLHLHYLHLTVSCTHAVSRLKQGPKWIFSPVCLHSLE